MLRERQEVQQRKTIRELSKIRNVNEFPLPGNIKLPDIPLPKAKNLLKLIARPPKRSSGGAKKPEAHQHDLQPELPSQALASAVEYSPASTPADFVSDDEMLR